MCNLFSNSVVGFLTMSLAFSPAFDIAQFPMCLTPVLGVYVVLTLEAFLTFLAILVCLFVVKNRNEKAPWKLCVHLWG